MNGLSLTKNQTLVATVGQEKRVTLWDLRDHNPIRCADLSPHHDDEALAVAVSSDGKWVATGGTAQVLKLWDAETLSLVASEAGHSGTVVDLKFSPDDKQLVTVGADGIILVWNLYA
jgi:WD40 repeat protein